MARNAYNVSFRERVAFFDVDETVRTITCDRTEFIGRNGTMANPDAMIRSRLSGKSGAGLDPCGAIQILVDLVEDQEKEIVFRLGAGLDADDAMRINNRSVSYTHLDVYKRQNRSRKKRTIEITSYAEVVLAPPAADESHPAFSNLFVQTQINHPRHAILCTRRPRSVDEETPWMFHLMKAHEAEIVLSLIHI